MPTTSVVMRSGVGAIVALGLVASALVAAPALAVEGAGGSGTPAVSEIRWSGEAGGDLGYGSSRWSCDVNGDGFEDTVVGDWWWKRGGTSNAGAAYVLLGGPQPVGGSIGTGEAVGSVRIDGPNKANASAGMSVSCVNDVNGDGLDDLIVGSNRTQRAWVILGNQDLEPVDVDALGTQGFEVTNSAAVANDAAGGSSNFGYWVSGLGDVNGDGLADFAVTDNLYDRPANPETGAPAASNIGRVTVVAGSQNVGTVDVADPAVSARILLTIDGSGGQISSAENIGDVNGDGLADLVLGSYGATPWGAGSPVAGAAYAIFGSATQQNLEISSLGTQGFAIWGAQRGRDRLGTSVAPIGDVNGDGLADFVVGGDGVTNAATGPRSGGAAVVFGSHSPQTVFTVPGAASNSVFSCDEETVNVTGTCSGATVNRGYWIDGAADGDKTGWAAAGLPDVSGDGIPEVLLGAWGNDSAGSNAGAVYVVYGQNAGGASIPLAGLTGEAGFRLDGAAPGAQLGRSVGSAGDFDGNGTADILSGANGTDTASVFLLGAAATAVDLTTGDLTVGSGGTLTAKVAPVREAAGTATGTVAFANWGVAIPGCEAVVVEAGTAECTAPSFPAGGAQQFSAMFHDASGAFADSSAEITADVQKMRSSVVVGGDTDGVAGDEIEFTAEVPSEATGAVEFFTGSTSIGSAAVVDGVATLPHVPAVATSFRLTATYSGDDRFAPADAKARRVNIELAPVHLSAVRLSAAKTVYGVRPTASVTVNGAATGQVLFTQGSTELGTAKVTSNGIATLKLPKLPVGNYRVVAQFLGDDTHADSAKRSATQSLSVVKASVSSAKVQTSTVKKNSRPTVTIRFGKLNNGAYPTGKVQVKFGGRSVTVAMSGQQKGVVKVKAPAALKSTVKVTAKYLGSANINAKSATATQRVK